MQAGILQVASIMLCEGGHTIAKHPENPSNLQQENHTFTVSYQQWNPYFVLGLESKAIHVHNSFEVSPDIHMHAISYIFFCFPSY